MPSKPFAEMVPALVRSLTELPLPTALPPSPFASILPELVM